MNDQKRKILVNAMVILGAMVFALVLVISVVRSGEEEDSKQQAKTGATIHEYSEKFDEEGKKDSEAKEEEKEAKKETKAVAEQFIRAFFGYDAKKPDQKLKEMKKYLSKEMKESEPDIPDGVKKGKVIAVEFLPESTQKGSRFFYAIKAQVETVFEDGTTEKTWTTYGVVVGEEENRWVIEGVGPIGDAGAEPLDFGGGKGKVQ